MAEQLELEDTGGGDDLRSSISAAVDAAEKAETIPETVAPVTSVKADNAPIGEESAQAKADRERDEKGRFATKKTEDEVKAKEVAPTPVTDKAPVEAPKPAMSTDGARPPSTWRPAAREHFSKLPPEVQQEVIRVDREFHQNKREYAEDRQLVQRMKETFDPYMPMLRAQNVDPFQFSANMAQTVAALSTGPQQTKAEIVANVIKTYGVDLATLAAVLDGQPLPQQSAQPQVYRDPRLDELLQTVEQAKAQRSAQLDVQAKESIRDIEQEEFFWDVKDEVADWLDMAANRNVAMTPREAYNRAIQNHPEIAKVVQQRQAAQAAVNPSGSTLRSKAAASSPRASPTVPAPDGASSRDLRAEIKAAWDAVEQSR